MNDALHLPGITKRMAQVCTDKYLFHETLNSAGLRNINCYATDADIINAEITNILSAKGSINLPKSVIILLFLAMYPSKKSVKLANKNIMNAKK